MHKQTLICDFSLIAGIKACEFEISSIFGGCHNVYFCLHAIWVVRRVRAIRSVNSVLIWCILYYITVFLFSVIACLFQRLLSLSLILNLTDFTLTTQLEIKEFKTLFIFVL